MTEQPLVESRLRQLQDTMLAILMQMGWKAAYERVRVAFIDVPIEAQARPAVAPEGLRAALVEVLHRYECDDEPLGHDWREHLPEDEPEHHPNRIDALVNLFDAIATAPAVASEGLRAALAALVEDTEHKGHDCGDTDCPVAQAIEALASDAGSVGALDVERLAVNGHQYVHVAACSCPEMQAEVARLAAYDAERQGER